MNKKTLASIFAFTAVATTVGTGVMSQSAVAKENSNGNEVLLAQSDGSNQNTNGTEANVQKTTSNTNTENTKASGTAVVINGDGSLVLMGSNTVKSNLVGYLSAGEMLTVQGQSGNWYKVTVQETGESGYIKAGNLQFIESGVNDPLSVLKGHGQVINVSSKLKIRETATMDSNTVGHLLNGDSFKILGKEGQWYKISANGVNGFIYSDYVAPSIINAVSNGTDNSSNTSVKIEGSNSDKVNKNTTENKETASTISKSDSSASVTGNTSRAKTEVSNSSKNTTGNSETASATSKSNSNSSVTGNTSNTKVTASSNSKISKNTTKNKETVSATSESHGSTSTISNTSNTKVEGPHTINAAAINTNNASQNKESNSTLYNNIYNIVKANFWTNPNTEGSTMSMNMSQTYNKDGVTYYSVYVHTTNSDNGEANTTHYYISTNGNILDGNSFNGKSNNSGSNSNSEVQVKSEVSQIANEYLSNQINGGQLRYSISINNTSQENGNTFYAVKVYNGSINDNNYISTIYVSTSGEVLGNLPQVSSNQNNSKSNQKIVKRTRSTADVIHPAS